MYNYWCSVFLLPKKVIKEVERQCCLFLWKGLFGSAVGAKVQWNIICRLKNEGG